MEFNVPKSFQSTVEPESAVKTLSKCAFDYVVKLTPCYLRSNEETLEVLYGKMYYENRIKNLNNQSCDVER